MSNRKLAIHLAGCTGAVLARHGRAVDGDRRQPGSARALRAARGLRDRRCSITRMRSGRCSRSISRSSSSTPASSRRSPRTCAIGAGRSFASRSARSSRPRCSTSSRIITSSTLLDGAEHGVLPSAGAIAFQVVESATKFSVSYLALFLFGLAIPRDTRLGLVLCLFLTAGTLASAVIGYALPPSAQASWTVADGSASSRGSRSRSRGCGAARRRAREA